MNSPSTSLDEALDALRVALDVNRATAVIAPEIRAQLRAVCASAVAAQMRPETLLLRVKQLLREVPAIATADLHRRTELTSRLVSLTIITYANVADALSSAAGRQSHAGRARMPLAQLRAETSRRMPCRCARQNCPSFGRTLMTQMTTAGRLLRRLYDESPARREAVVLSAGVTLRRADAAMHGEGQLTLSEQLRLSEAIALLSPPLARDAARLRAQVLAARSYERTDVEHHAPSPRARWEPSAEFPG